MEGVPGSNLKLGEAESLTVGSFPETRLQLVSCRVQTRNISEVFQIYATRLPRPPKFQRGLEISLCREVVLEGSTCSVAKLGYCTYRVLVPTRSSPQSQLYGNLGTSM
ncbi:hypothetical protein R1flu_007755 [Riccia fluitans]|uniref:Uncharacterized protein n=1 Tax=Riccia fluitans TaxID=41844 RepID=A0ABD1Z0A5_9MARC